MKCFLAGVVVSLFALAGCGLDQDITRPESDEATISAPATSTVLQQITTLPPVTPSSTTSAPTTEPTTTTTEPPRIDAKALFEERFAQLGGDASNEPDFYEQIRELCGETATASDAFVLAAAGQATDWTFGVLSLVCPDQVTRVVDLRHWATSGGAIDPTMDANAIALPAADPPADGTTVVVTDVIDGDTITTSAGKVRIIGYDTPEMGAPCSMEAKYMLENLLADGHAILLPEPGREDTDDYGRLLRHVYPAGSGIPVGQSIIGARLGVARYDSQDGYQWHRHEELYRHLSSGISCWDRQPVPVVAEPPPPTTTLAPPPTPSGSSGTPGKPTEYNGPRCYEPGGKTWKPCSG